MSVSERTRPAALAALTTWRARQWAVAAAVALGCVVLIGVPTDLIETPLFSRAVPPTWWLLCRPWPFACTSGFRCTAGSSGRVVLPLNPSHPSPSRWCGREQDAVRAGCTRRGMGS